MTNFVLAFLKQLLNGSKKQLKVADIRKVEVPMYPEVRLISVADSLL